MMCIFFSCKPCSKQYTGSTESFPSRFNNIKSAHRIFIKQNTAKQASLHARFEDDTHVISDWEIILIDQTDTVTYSEVFWAYITYTTSGLGETDAPSSAMFKC